MLRSGRADEVLRRLLRLGRAWLSSVAVSELYAGAVLPDDRRALARLISDTAFGRRMVTPTHEDWLRGGQLLARRSRLQGAVRPRDHLSDLLILLSAERIGARVATSNVRHFADWARLAGLSPSDVVAFPADP